MIRKRFLVSAILLLPVSARAQSFFDVLRRADSVEQAGGHAAAVRLYEQAYTLSGFDPAGLGLAARSAAKAGLRDVAIRDLDRAIDQGYIVPKLLNDSAFAVLRKDPRWKAIDAKMQKKVAALNLPLRQKVIALAEQDRKNRQDFNNLLKKVGASSPEGRAGIKSFTSADSAVQGEMKGVIAEFGWPTRSRVADDGAHAAWLVVQHMSKEDQEALLPKLLAAVKAGEAQPGDGAMLQDRVLSRQKKPQVYGSAMSIAKAGEAPVLDPIADENCVDVRRRSVGLEPIASYLKGYGITYKAKGPCVSAPKP